LLIVLATGQAESASFDCSKSTTQVDHLICDNPALGARDDIMANLYTAVLKRHEDGNIRDHQRRWLSTFQACTDAPCVKDYRDDRINALMDTKGARELSTHFFAKGSNGNEGWLSVFGPQHGSLAV
jgi:uncharacterized protein